MKLLAGTAAESGAFFQPAPLHPPLDWFSDAAADRAPERFTVYPDGSCAGIVAPAGRCLLDGTGECWTVPRPRDGRGSSLQGDPSDDYRIANQGVTVTADGVAVATGVLAGGGGHARPGLGALTAGKHYADTNDQKARVRYVWSDTAGNGVGGVVAVGALWPEVTERDVAAILASATSVDYRLVVDEGQYRFVGTCLVNIGGLPSRYVASLSDGLALSDSWVPEHDVPTEFVAALGLAAPATLDGMKRRLRYCTTCPPVERTAAFRAVTPAGPAWFAEVTYAGGVGAFTDVLFDPSGAEQWVVHPVVDGMIDDEQRVVVPAADATLTGRRFEWVEVEEMAVVDGAVALEDDEPMMASAAVVESPAEVAAQRDALQQQVAALTDEVAALRSHLVKAELDALPESVPLPTS